MSLPVLKVVIVCAGPDSVGNRHKAYRPVIEWCAGGILGYHGYCQLRERCWPAGTSVDCVIKGYE